MEFKGHPIRGLRTSRVVGDIEASPVALTFVPVGALPIPEAARPASRLGAIWSPM